MDNLSKEELKTYPVPTWISVDSWNNNIAVCPWKVQAVIRDNYKCVDCGNGHKKLIVHHIDESGGKGNNSLNNLVTLCRLCHSKRHGHFVIDSPIIDRLNKIAPDKILYTGVLTDISKEFNLSRERIRQIAKKMGFQMPRKTSQIMKVRKCEICGKEFEKEGNHVNDCCSPECYKELRFKRYWNKTQCLYCSGVIVYRKIFDTLGKTPIYCSKSCQGSYLAREFGFKRKMSDTDIIRLLSKKFKRNWFSLMQFSSITGYLYQASYTKCLNLISKGYLEYKIKGRIKLLRLKT